MSSLFNDYDMIVVIFYTMVASLLQMGLFDFYGICFDQVDLYIRTVDFNQEMELEFRAKNGHDTYSVYLLMMRLFLMEMISQLACI